MNDDNKYPVTIRNWSGLQSFGINALTGESCAIGLRLLCDLNIDGVRLMQAYLGNNIESQAGSNWNSQVNGKDAIASIMIGKYSLEDLAIFALSFYGYQSIFTTNGVISGFIDCDDNREHREYYRQASDRHYKGTGKDSRNTHQFSGRVS